MDDVGAMVSEFESLEIEASQKDGDDGGFDAGVIGSGGIVDRSGNPSGASIGSAASRFDSFLYPPEDFARS